MNLVIFGNYLNHHQAPLADELYGLLGDRFTFVQTEKTDWREMKGGNDYSTRPYFMCAAESQENQDRAWALVRTCDVALFIGIESIKFEIERARVAPEKLSFEVSERWFKRGWINILSPRLLTHIWYYHTLFSKARIYKLCASAYAAADLRHLHLFGNRCFKWGYFTEPAQENDTPKPAAQPIKLLWCARFIDWKHPELAIQLAARLKAEGALFVLHMLGDGELRPQMEQLVADLQLTASVNFLGNLPNAEVRQQMREHDIFVFTSDQNEGWGTVANEAMSEGCVLVGADAIGAVPYLVNDGETGMVFKSGNLDSLFEKVNFLMHNPSAMIRIAEAGKKQIKERWSPANAARNLLQLIETLQQKRPNAIVQGPCSNA